MNFKERAKRLKSDIPAIFLALKDKDTPIIAKILAGITVAYALSPVDLIPDFIPVLGYLDDLLILPALAALTINILHRNIGINYFCFNFKKNILYVRSLIGREKNLWT